MRETRHFAKRAAERPGSSGGNTRRKLACDRCTTSPRGRRDRCRGCDRMLCVNCLPKEQGSLCLDCRFPAALGEEINRAE